MYEGFIVFKAYAGGQVNFIAFHEPNGPWKEIAPKLDRAKYQVFIAGTNPGSQRAIHIRFAIRFVDRPYEA